MPNLIGPSFKKKMTLWRLPKTEGSILKYIVPPLWPTSIGERMTSCAEAYGIKVRCYGEHREEHIANLLEHIENIKGTLWEHSGDQEKMKKIPPPPQNFKGKEPRHHECMLGPSHWLKGKQIPIPIEFVTIFGLNEQPTY
jgi:hypothetical protein